jgi:hypothetical protein
MKFGDIDSLHRDEFIENLGVQIDTIIKNAQLARGDSLNAALTKLRSCPST